MGLTKGQSSQARWEPVTIELWRALGIPEPTEGEPEELVQARALNVLTWKRPSVAAMGYLKEELGKLAINRPQWKPDLAYYVALMAQCHVRQASDDAPPLDLYMGVVEGPEANDDVFWWLRDRLLRTWPNLCLPDDLAALASIDPDFARQIKAEGTVGLRIEALLRLGQLTLECLKRYWGDCVDVPADALADMDAIDQGKNTEMLGLRNFLESLVRKA